jgi:hypothetical protein
MAQRTMVVPRSLPSSRQRPYLLEMQAFPFGIFAQLGS